MPQPSENNKRIAKNTLALYVRMFLLLLITLYTSRVVLKVLGVTDYGIYNIVGGVIVFFSFINSALAGATQRFLNYELGKNDSGKLKSVFNASLYVHLIVVVIIVVLGETVGLWFVYTQLNIPPERFHAGLAVYHLSIVTFCINVLRAPFNAAIIANEKMTYYAYISIVEAVLKLAIVYLLTLSAFDKLIFYGGLTLITSVVITGIYILYCKRNFYFVGISRRCEKTTVKSLLSFSLWSCFGNLSNIVSSQGLNILLNLFWGVTVNAAMGLANHVSAAIYGFIGNFQTAFNPSIIKLYASEEIERHNKLIYQASKMSFFLFWLLFIPFVLNSYYILDIWLDKVPLFTDIFCQLLLADQCLFALSGPLWVSAQATGQIKNYMLTVGILNMLTLPVSYLFLFWGYNPSIVIVIKILFDLCTYIYRLYFLKYKIGFPLLEYVRKVVLPILKVIILSLPLPVFVYFVVEQEIFCLITTTLTALTTVLLSVYCAGLSKTERDFCLEFIKKKFEK